VFITNDAYSPGVRPSAGLLISEFMQLRWLMQMNLAVQQVWWKYLVTACRGVVRVR
jgi:hypothetical protein